MNTFIGDHPIARTVSVVFSSLQKIELLSNFMFLLFKFGSKKRDCS